MPEAEKNWTTIYYGSRGSGKTYHQAKEVVRLFKYLDHVYEKNPKLKKSIVLSVQKFSPAIETAYLGKYLYYWDDVEDLHYCPREDCWRGPERHRLHGAYIIFDDIATILPADSWQNTPIWLRKTFAQARHFGIHVLANLQDPFSCDVNFRRYTDVAYRFRKTFGSRDPDETKPPIKHIFGIYHRRQIPAEWLWKMGDLPEHVIREEKSKAQEEKRVTGKSTLFMDIWKGSVHWISRKGCEYYDTLQDVPEYKPKGFLHSVLHCIDPKCNHTDPDAPNYCNYKKVYHDLT